MQTIIPCLIYQDAEAAIKFLCAAFGFAEKLVVPGEPGQVLHAELVLDGNMVMVSSATNKLSPERPPMTGYVYVILAGPDAHHARAAAHGAKIICAPRDNDYGGRGYEALDLEGNYWAFGTFNPWAVPGPEVG